MITLAFLVLLSVLIIAFFLSVQTESQSAQSYSQSVAVKQLVESATHVFMGQLSDGTKSVKEPGNNSSERITWASQPGMIRTWDSSGNGWKLFKLYSARQMVVDFNGVYKSADALANEVPSGWSTQTALYTDLNRPVLVPDTSGTIVPNSALPNSKFRAEFPIIDPGALTDKVEGFNLAVPPDFSGSISGTDPVTKLPMPDVTGNPIKTVSANPAPMPVAWIYVLRDGTLTSPAGTSNGGHTAHWQGAPAKYAPSATNPIVGRFAFWADDEACKVNVNTASEPTAWDTPRGISIQDLNYGKFQPARNEYQRYPGHPFTTALSPVLFPGVTLTSAQKEDIYGVIPRIQTGGSTGGTVAVPITNTSASIITPDSDRLFANVDEFLFNPSRGENSLITSKKPQLRRARFFLTANSRAPEVNLYGKPRISLWPENSDPAKRSPFDTLAAFCTTLGDATSGTPQLFYFQRSDATSPTMDYDNIARNKVLYKYLQDLTSAKLPGFGSDFASKWKTDRDQVLTEIFDYIRCVNLRDKQAGATAYANNGQVAPIKIADTKGFGRFQTISQFGIHFICSQDYPASAAAAKGDTGANAIALAKDERAIEAAIIFEPYSPSLGYYELYEALSYEITVKSPMKVNDKDLQFPTTQIVKSSSNRFGGIWHGRNWGGAQGIRGLINSLGGASYPLVSKRTKVTGASKKVMSFSGGQLEVKVYSGTAPSPATLVQTFTVSFPPGPTEIPIPELVSTGTEGYRGATATTADYWWTFAKRYSAAGGCPHAPGAEYADPARRWDKDSKGAAGFKNGGIFREEDVVRSIVPANGDIRLLAGRTIVDKNADGSDVFIPGAKFTDSSRKLDHLFTEPQGPHMLYGFGNEPGLTSKAGDQLVADPKYNYHYARLPEITPGAGKLYNKWNDFDNGFAHLTDGSYINKPDEGNIASQNSAYPYFSWDFTAPSEFLFSPNRLMPSAGMLGSLPTGVKRNQPWQTLLFRPQSGHPGEGVPKSGPPYTTLPDHLIMDLFWMPIVEPYAISEPFSTAGKINMNYEIAPFSYIRRATGLRAVMKSEEPFVVPNEASKISKLWDHETNDWPSYANSARCSDPQVRSDWDKAYKGLAPFDKMRRPLAAEETLKQFDARFADGRIFRSASEICELHLVREGELLTDYTGGTDFWSKNLPTGENTRERPYTNLYGRLTTKSNVFTVHFRAQVLRKAGSASPAEWNEDKDQMVSDYRGSTMIERYIDPANPSFTTGSAKFVDLATSTNATVDDFYRLRVISTKKFVP